MSKINIYGTHWLNMVFEGRNKKYGAYQLRLENPKTTARALFSAIGLFAIAASIPVIIQSLKPKETASVTKTDDNNRIILVDMETLKKKEPIIEPKKQEETTKSEAKKTERFIPMKPAKKEVATQEVTTNKALENAQVGPEKKEGTPSTGSTTTPVATTSNHETSNIPNNTVEMSSTLEVQPQYPGGIAEFLKDVSRKFNTPSVEENTPNLRVLVYFVIEKDGSLSNIKITRDPGYNLGKEAFRVISGMKTKWSPGYKNGQPVRTAYNLPIVVNLE